MISAADYSLSPRAFRAVGDDLEGDGVDENLIAN